MMTDISHITDVRVLGAATRAAKTPAATAGAAAPREDTPTSGLAAVDIAGFSSVLFVATGTGAGALTLSVKHGDEPDALEDALDDCLIHDDDADTTATTQKLGYIGARRYVQLVGATAGVVILQRPAVMPV